MKVTVNEAERGFLFRKGCFEKMLMPGTYHVFGQTDIRKLALNQPFQGLSPALLAVYAKDAAFAAQTITQEVADGQVALHYVDGCFVEGLRPGKHTFWNVAQKHSFQIYETNEPEISGLSEAIYLNLCQQRLVQVIQINPQDKGILFYDGQYERLLEPGIYHFWTTGKSVICRHMNIARQELSLTGQEILTKDKIGIRLNFVCTYQLTDCLKAYLEISSYESQFHTAVQLTVRDYIAGLTLDELLNQRDVIGQEILTLLRPKAEEMYISVLDAGIRDIILPGDVRDILNTVLIAEKRAQANVITRREEVASTRSLLNTAKLMDENKTLYKLKELEYLEKICEHVGNISVSGGDLLEHLRAIVGAKE